MKKIAIIAAVLLILISCTKEKDNYKDCVNERESELVKIDDKYSAEIEENQENFQNNIISNEVYTETYKRLNKENQEQHEEIENYYSCEDI